MLVCLFFSPAPNPRRTVGGRRLRIEDASSTAHLDKVERGYEKMDHYKVDFRRERKALSSIDFIRGKGM
ncbi:hypothetical protein GOODEAATRI_019883 [Goodea atripinnis]|uniref:COS domain-containing protein n=1 Tax=Goodea atripinnis TaxID=208336 RepID=A0ABV0N478_9TELE